MSISPTIDHWLVSAKECVGARTISPSQGDKEDTAEIFTLPTRVTFQPGTTAGRIVANCSVLIDLQPGIVSDFLLSVFQTNPTLKAVVLKLNNADVEKIGARVGPYVPKGSMTNRTLGTTLAKGMVRLCCSQVENRRPRRRRLVDLPRHTWFFENACCVPSTRNCTCCKHYRHWVLLRASHSLKGSPRQRTLPGQV